MLHTAKLYIAVLTLTLCSSAYSSVVYDYTDGFAGTTGFVAFASGSISDPENFTDQQIIDGMFLFGSVSDSFGFLRTTLSCLIVGSL